MHQISNLRIGDISKFEGEDERIVDPEDLDEPDQDTIETVMDGEPWVGAAMAWLKLICKHQAVLSSLTKEKDKVRFTVIKNMRFENISVEL